jgi:hypothetical protein
LRARAAGSLKQIGRKLRDELDQAGVGVCLRVVVVKAVDIRKKHQQVASQKTETMALSVSLSPNTLYAPFQFPHRYRVVFVDDGNHAHLEQGGKRGAQVFRPSRVLHVFPREQNLPHVWPYSLKKLVIQVHQLALPTAAAACLARSSFGRQGMPNLYAPMAMAPELTRTI